MIPVVVSGGTGRLGSRIAAHVEASSGLELAAILLRLGAAATGPKATSDLACVSAGRVLIETAPKKVALEHVALAAERSVPVLVATTGFDPEERRALEAHGAKTPVLVAPNLSLGVAVLTDLVERCARLLPDHHAEIVELHHAKKRDAPSGTAWALARALDGARGRDAERDAILARAGEVGPRSETEIGIQAVRGGDIVGEHTVYFVGASERIELTHRAQSRDVFAAGAVAAARFLGAPGRAPGVYGMRDVLELVR